MQNQSTKELIEQLKRNDETTRKFFEIEKRILSILNYKDLFEVLLDEIKKKFNMPFVWLSIIEKSEVMSLIQDLERNVKIPAVFLYLITDHGL